MSGNSHVTNTRETRELLHRAAAGPVSTERGCSKHKEGDRRVEDRWARMQLGTLVAVSIWGGPTVKECQQSQISSDRALGPDLHFFWGVKFRILRLTNWYTPSLEVGSLVWCASSTSWRYWSALTRIFTVQEKQGSSQMLQAAWLSLVFTWLLHF